MCVSILAITSVCCSIESNAFEKGKFYISGTYGIGIADKFDYDDKELATRRPSKVNVFGLAAGYQFNDNIRAELSYTGFYGLKYKGEKDQGGDFIDPEIYTYTQKTSLDSLFINTYFDINKFGNIKPYITAGIGVARVKVGTIIAASNRSNDIAPYADGRNNDQFAWNLGAGINYEINDHIEFNVINYKYNNFGKIKTKEGNANDEPALTTKLAIHSVNTGIIFKF
jgi:opacity protein-like surface antigen